MDVYPAYYQGLSGKGITVVVLDDGLDTNHSDIKKHFSEEVSTNLDDPTNGDYSPHGPHKHMLEGESHGTKVAGLIGAIGENGFCSHGVAYQVNIGAVRLLNGVVTDIKEARSLMYNTEQVDVYCLSWGPLDDGTVMDQPQFLTWRAFEYGQSKGRHGLGSIYVYASGNGGIAGDHCGADGFVSSPFGIAVTALDEKGGQPYYAEPCSATRLAMPTGGVVSSESPYADILPSTDVNNVCIASFMGTSASAPMAAGCLSLMMEANPLLTSRDIEHILPWATRIPASDSTRWQVNAGGVLHSPLTGFGQPSCYGMVELARRWKPVAPWCLSRVSTETRLIVNWADNQGVLESKPTYETIMNHEEAVSFASELHKMSGLPILVDTPTRLTFMVNKSIGVQKYEGDGTQECNNQVVSKIVVRVQWKHMCRGSLSFWLTSPSGGQSELLGYRRNDAYAGEGDMKITTVAHWGEAIYGEWVFEAKTKLVCKNYSPMSTEAKQPRGKVHFVELEFWGQSANESAVQRNRKLLQPFLTTVGHQAVIQQKSHWLNSSEIAATFEEQRDISLRRVLSVKQQKNRFVGL